MNEAEQRKAFEAFFIASGLAYEWGGTVWFHDASHANDLWRGWQAAASIHAEKVEQLRAALQAFNLKEEWIVAGTADSLALRVPMTVIQQAAAALNATKPGAGS